MKNIKPIVQVMNLFSLVRINSAKSKVEEFGITQEVLTKVISSIMYNDNIVFDKHNIIPDENKPILNIYIASDFGFCSSYNGVVLNQIKRDKDAYKIIIGKKINYDDGKVVMKINKEDFYQDLSNIKNYLVKAITNKDYSEINIFYNHYYNFSRSDFTEIHVFPVEYDEKYKEDVDFLIETDITSFINNLTTYYVCYQLEICEIFSWASENVIRNTVTTNSLNKLDELENEEKLKSLRAKRLVSLKKNIENSKKVMFIDEN